LSNINIKYQSYYIVSSDFYIDWINISIYNIATKWHFEILYVLSIFPSTKNLL